MNASNNTNVAENIVEESVVMASRERRSRRSLACFDDASLYVHSDASSKQASVRSVGLSESGSFSLSPFVLLQRLIVNAIRRSTSDVSGS